MKFKQLLVLACVLGCILGGTSSVYGQSFRRNAGPGPGLKNTVRFNLSGLILFSGGYTVLGYERVMKPYQSFSVNFGVAKLPNFKAIHTDNFDLERDIQNNGYNFSVDYRFYLKSENKYFAPRGIYLGPYYSFNFFNRANAWDYQNGTATVNTGSKFSIHTVGIELGYQFVIRDRLAIDLVMIGPGMGFYNFKGDITSNTNLSQESKEELFDAAQQLITQRFPGMNLIIDEKEVSGDGVLRTTTVGFRYLIQLGYRF